MLLWVRASVCCLVKPVCSYLKTLALLSMYHAHCTAQKPLQQAQWST
ncbi:hypothetical protein HMPREF9248_0654 [Fannyhessea vaginae PB189-T1-4]|uniref:Uncharacterized protein n=1 Tax=Fannyhessea vaginae PB189-T1-4 TaxID=866774 RepID=A0ABN0AYS8_9ACTN|nr:hypothetical protein HMPREF9248_0654 [Fannyhessea vaginae PB189-T1-4]